jgi:radical SAM protein with 4Fe4S-binding SPASM domain
MNNTYTQFKGNNPFASQSKILFHSDRIADYLQNQDCKPVFCEVNLTDVCNLRCKWCISDNFRGNSNSLSFIEFCKFASEFKDYGGKALTFSGGGEPTLSKDFAPCTRFCSSIGLEVGLMTNGCYSSDYNVTIANHMKWMRISLDTLDVKHYAEWKGVDRLNVVLNNIKIISKIKSKIKVGINCNIHPDLTVQEVKDLISLVDEYGLSYVQFRPIIPRYYTNESLIINDGVWEYLKDINNPKINFSYDKYYDLTSSKLFPFKACEAHRLNFVLNSNGDICVCMYHPNDSRFVLGNIKNNTFQEIWQSQQRLDVIKFLQTRLDMKKECQICCKLYELNKLFDFLDTSKDNDINFL